jgi:TolA-binding protein
VLKHLAKALWQEKRRVTSASPYFFPASSSARHSNFYSERKDTKMSSLLEMRVGRSIRFLIATACVTTIALACVSLASAQGGGVDSTGTGGRHSIVGRIYFPSGRRSDIQVKVKLQSYGAGELTALSDMNGSFAFKGLNPGSYVVIVDGGDDYEPFQETVYIETDGNTSRNGIRLPVMPRSYNVQVSLQPKRGTSTKAGVLNAGLANVPEAAAKLYEMAVQLADAKETAKAIESLNEALRLFPNFPLALNELGVQFLKLGQPDKAIEPLRSATRLAPTAFTPRLNLGTALLESNQFADAENELREALKISSTPPAHMYLGLTLICVKRYDEAQHELETAISTGGENLGQVHRYLGGIYWRLAGESGQKRDYARAVNEFETYLRLTPNAPDAERIRGTIKELRTKS